MTARIFRQTPSVTQSGPGSDKPWRLVFDPEQPRSIDPLMGWTSSGDMKQQLRLRFETKDEAVAYCERNGIAYEVFETPPHKLSRMSYSDNFAYTRRGAWTH